MWLRPHEECSLSGISSDLPITEMPAIRYVVGSFHPLADDAHQSIAGVHILSEDNRLGNRNKVGWETRFLGVNSGR